MSRKTRSTEHLIEVGARIRLIRSYLKMTQGEFGTLFAVGPTAVTNWESGVRMPDIQFLIQIANNYGFSVDWVLRNDRSGLPHHLAQNIMELQQPGAPPVEDTDTKNNDLHDLINDMTPDEQHEARKVCVKISQPKTHIIDLLRTKIPDPDVV